MRAPRITPALQALLPLASFALIFSVASCSDGTAPKGGADSGELAIGGSYDADDGQFVLGVTDTLPGNPLLVELIGSELVTDPETEQLSLRVALRNLGDDIHPPVMLWLSEFQPAAVYVLNPDAVRMAEGPDDLLPPAYGFDYSALFGEDGVLSAGETSQAKLWLFHDPGLGSFAFHARLEAGLVPGLPRIAGRVWEDYNGNGVLEAGEPGWPGAPIVVATPEGELISVFSGPQGRYSVPALTAGLYRLECDFSEFGMIPPFFTTPNPLNVLIAPGPDGELQSYLHAHFGIRWGDDPPPGPPPVVFTEAPPESLHFGHWSYIEGGVEGDRLDLRVGFSGCQPEQPWTCYISGGFMESYPVQVRAVLVHEVEEECDATFEETLHFDLWPLKRAYVEAYGPNQMLLIDLIDFSGAVHQIEYWIEMPDSTWVDPGEDGSHD